MHHRPFRIRRSLLVLASGMVAACTSVPSGRAGSGPAVSDGMPAPTVRTLDVRGSLSVTGTQTMSGVPFSATIAGADSMRVTMNGPLGIIMARLYATPTTFVMVNYLQQQGITGSPASEQLQRDLPVPIAMTDLMALMRGALPGDVARFRPGAPRSDGQRLWQSSSDQGTEFALVDTARAVLTQYQRKSPSGSLLLNVSYGDIRTVDGVAVAHSVGVLVNDRKESITFTMQDIRVNGPVDVPLSVDIPAGFKTTTYR